MGFLEMDQFRFRFVRHVIQTETAALVGIAFGFFHRRNVGDGNAQFGGEFGVCGLTAEFGF